MVRMALGYSLKKHAQINPSRSKYSTLIQAKVKSNLTPTENNGNDEKKLGKQRKVEKMELKTQKALYEDWAAYEALELGYSVKFKRSSELSTKYPRRLWLFDIMSKALTNNAETQNNIFSDYFIKTVCSKREMRGTTQKITQY